MAGTDISFLKPPGETIHNFTIRWTDSYRAVEHRPVAEWYAFYLIDTILANKERMTDAYTQPLSFQIVTCYSKDSWGRVLDLEVCSAKQHYETNDSTVPGFQVVAKIAEKGAKIVRALFNLDSTHVAVSAEDPSTVILRIPPEVANAVAVPAKGATLSDLYRKHKRKSLPIPSSRRGISSAELFVERRDKRAVLDPDVFSHVATDNAFQKFCEARRITLLPNLLAFVRAYLYFEGLERVTLDSIEEATALLTISQALGLPELKFRAIPYLAKLVTPETFLQVDKIAVESKFDELHRFLKAKLLVDPTFKAQVEDHLCQILRSDNIASIEDTARIYDLPKTMGAVREMRAEKMRAEASKSLRSDAVYEMGDEAAKWFRSFFMGDS